MAPSAVDAVESQVGPASGPEVILEPEMSPPRTAQRSQPRHEEYQYLDLIRQILDEGEHRPDR
jgi:thymidylate synthase